MSSPENNDQQVYALVIMPTEEITETIRIFKEGLAGVAGKFASAYADPVITLFAAIGDAERITDLEKKLEVICRNQLPFNVHLENFNEFQAHKTVFVDITETSKSAITKLRKTLSAELKASKYDEEIDFNVGKTPHITIARNLQDDQYRVARNYFTGRTYSAFFECYKLTWRKLVKIGNSAYYVTDKEFPFAMKNLSLF
jgi:2'-5' RNA ligase